MAIRVTQKTMYNDMVGQMQSSLANYMNTVEQGSSQKKINRPSDDPAGTYRVLTTRNDISSTKQLQTNIDTAKGWLNLADDVLSNQVTTQIAGLKSLAEQASTGTYTADQRMLMAEEARSYFNTLLNLANTEFEGKQIFGGHRYDSSAFVQETSATTWDERWDEYVKKGYATFAGSSDTTVLVQFTDQAATDIANGTEYRWSNNGGKTWEIGNIVANAVDNSFILDAGGVTMTLRTQDNNGDPLLDKDGNPIVWRTQDYNKTDFLAGGYNGTMLYLRPAAIYKGDDNDPPPDIGKMGGHPNTTASAGGSFAGNVLVRFDDGNPTGNPIDLTTAGNEFTWSYSVDNGTTWITTKGLTPGADQVRLPVPGGYLDVDAAGDGGEIALGTQFIIHPARGDLQYEILEDTYIGVNSVGKDVFGGLYNRIETWNSDEGMYVPGLEGDQNLFEVVGAFIGYLEGNNQEGCQKTLAALDVAEKKVLAEAARIGGLENRISMASSVLSFQRTDQEERLSYAEDIDLTELLTKLTRQQLTYQTVLQSSSMIMQLSLANYV